MSNLEGLMRGILILVLIVIVIAGALFFLSSRAHQVPTQTVEVDVTNAVSH